MTENLDSTANDAAPDYMRESYTTDDGLVVPPPTREMGPRRLSRYRLDVADFLRALRDGKPLPEEPIEYMGTLPQGEAGSDTRKIYDRYLELLEEGAFSAEQADETAGASVAAPAEAVEFTEETNVPAAEETVEEVVFTSDDFVTPEAEPTVEASADEEVITSEELAEVINQPETGAISTADAAVESTDEPHPYSHLFDDGAAAQDAEKTAVSTDAASNISDIASPVVAEEPAAVASPAVTESAPADDAEQSKATPNRFDLIRAKAEKARSVSGVSGLPEPVSALSSQGLDLEPLNQAEERAAETRAAEESRKAEEQAAASKAAVAEESPVVAEPVAEQVVSEPVVAEEPVAEPVVSEPVVAEEPVTEAQPKPEVAEEQKPTSSGSVAQAVTQRSRQGGESKISQEVIEEARVSTPVDMPDKKSSTANWLMILSLVVVIALVVIWMMFFK